MHHPNIPLSRFVDIPNWIKEVIQDFVKAVPTDDPHQVETYGEFTHRLSRQFPLHLKNISAKVVAIEDDAAILDLGDETWPGDEDAHVSHNIFSCDPCEIANQLNQYWLPIWQKDTQIDDLEQNFPNLQQITQHFPAHPAIEVDMQNPDLWIAAIKKQKAGIVPEASMQFPVKNWNSSQEVSSLCSLIRCPCTKEGFRFGSWLH